MNRTSIQSKHSKLDKNSDTKTELEKSIKIEETEKITFHTPPSRPLPAPPSVLVARNPTNSAKHKNVEHHSSDEDINPNNEGNQDKPIK